MAAVAKDLGAVDALIARHAAPERGAAWAENTRASARARLNAMGAPTGRDEYWKFTDPTPLTAAEAAEYSPARHDDVPVFDDVDALRLVFVDGEFSAELSDDPSMEGVEIHPLATALGADIHWAKGFYGTLEAAGQSPVPRPLAALNTATATSGFVIRATGEAPRPIMFRYLHRDKRSDAVIRHLIRVEEGASLTILETGPAASRFNKTTEIDVAPTGEFHHVRTQGREHERLAATHMFARLGQESVFKSFTLTVNGRLTRNEVVIEFTGDDAKGHIAGCCIGDGNFHHDDTVFVTHDAVNCESRQVFKKVLKNGAKGIFQGKILVQPDAQKTDGYQISQGLLLTDNAEFSAKPELEIYADDVACSHGSTCGAVDETALFYLRSRGVPLSEAQDMMVLAFVDEAVQEIEDDALADEIRAKIAEWLGRRRE
ncbi:MAG: SufD family Fe-S cluster assembly protein [Pseudomonadota bacterium]